MAAATTPRAVWWKLSIYRSLSGFEIADQHDTDGRPRERRVLHHMSVTVMPCSNTPYQSTSPTNWFHWLCHIPHRTGSSNDGSTELPSVWPAICQVQRRIPCGQALSFAFGCISIPCKLRVRKHPVHDQLPPLKRTLQNYKYGMHIQSHLIATSCT